GARARGAARGDAAADPARLRACRELPLRRGAAARMPALGLGRPRRRQLDVADGGVGPGDGVDLPPAHAPRRPLLHPRARLDAARGAQARPRARHRARPGEPVGGGQTAVAPATAASRPALAGIDLADAALHASDEIHAVFRHLRDHEPLYWNPERSEPGFWSVTRYADGIGVLKDAHTFSSAQTNVLGIHRVGGDQ